MASPAPFFSPPNPPLFIPPSRRTSLLLLLYLFIRARSFLPLHHPLLAFLPSSALVVHPSFAAHTISLPYPPVHLIVSLRSPSLSCSVFSTAYTTWVFFFSTVPLPSSPPCATIAAQHEFIPGESCALLAFLSVASTFKSTVLLPPSAPPATVTRIQRSTTARASRRYEAQHCENYDARSVLKHHRVFSTFSTALLLTHTATEGEQFFLNGRILTYLSRFLPFLFRL
ncbi:hypothetical protein B0H12DRAFT_222271 [Mycena haematopus]|nr:hypothetical protein B0H12DRAFT_222271 [Mycena haematopus]